MIFIIVIWVHQEFPHNDSGIAILVIHSMLSHIVGDWEFILNQLWNYERRSLLSILWRADSL